MRRSGGTLAEWGAPYARFGVSDSAAVETLIGQRAKHVASRHMVP